MAGESLFSLVVNSAKYCVTANDPERDHGQMEPPQVKIMENVVYMVELRVGSTQSRERSFLRVLT